MCYIIIVATFTETLSDVDTTFGSDVRLKCAVSDTKADCEWYKDNIPLDAASAGIDGHQRYLHIASISHDGDGEYECRCGFESTEARVDVKGLPTFYFQIFHKRVKSQCKQIGRIT